jgi:hypothetical protein
MVLCGSYMLKLVLVRIWKNNNIDKKRFPAYLITLIAKNWKLGGNNISVETILGGNNIKYNKTLNILFILKMISYLV